MSGFDLLLAQLSTRCSPPYKIFVEMTPGIPAAHGYGGTEMQSTATPYFCRQSAHPPSIFAKW